MADAALKEQIRAIISDVIEVEGFGDEEDLIQDLGADSMMGLEIVARMEKAFRIRISEEYLPQLRTLNHAVQIVTEVQGAHHTVGGR